MKKTALLCLIGGLCSSYATASDIISAMPLDELGKQPVSIHSYSASSNSEERALNVLYNPETDKQKWCDNKRLFPWVVFDLTHIYTVDKVTFRDVRPYESKFANVPEYWVYVSTEEPAACNWIEVAHKKEGGSLDVKEITFDPIEARYVKLKLSRGTTDNGARDNAIRIYGVDIYGTFSREVDRGDLVSVGKTIYAHYTINKNSTRFAEGPFNIIDGNMINNQSKWYFKDLSATDSVCWTIIDLENSYDIERFKLYDAKTLEPSAPNIAGYNVYVSETMPDLSLISGGKDNNTCWHKAVDAYAQNRLEENIKTDEVSDCRGRYVKLEIPLSRTNSDKKVRIFQFEVYGKQTGTTNVNAVESAQPQAVVYPNRIQPGETFRVQTGTGSGTIKIYSDKGTLCAEYPFTDTQTRIASTGMPAGTYIVQVTGEGKNIASASLIIK